MNPIDKALKDTCPPFYHYNYEIETAPWLYEKYEDGGVKCNICKRHCVIPPGKMGFCLARENREGILINRINGSLQSLFIESKQGFEELMVNGFYCNFRCRFCFAHTWLNDKKELPQIKPFCFPFNGRKLKEDAEDSIERKRIMANPATIVQIAKERGIFFLTLARSEPTVNVEFSMVLARLALENGIGTILWTNGYSTEQITRDYAKIMAHIYVGIKCYWDQAGYDAVVSPDGKIDVDEILNTVLDLHKYGANYTINIIADGQHGSPQAGYKMFQKIKDELGEEEISSINIIVHPVVYFTDKRMIINPQTQELLCDQLNVRPGDVLGSVEFEMGLQKMGFKNARSDYSVDYKSIYGDYPNFWMPDAKGGCLENIVKEQSGTDIKSYVYRQ